MAEAKLSELCTQAAMVPNPATRDVHGYDNVVQVETAQASPAHDLIPTPVRAFVQAKATQKKSGSIGIRLTNWQHMIADPEPWFVFVCEVDADRRVTDIFLVHINEHWMEKALRRLRNYSVKGKKLGKNEMAINYGQADRLPQIHGKELRTRIESVLGGNVKAYRDRKNRFYTTCGYDAGAHRARVSFPAKPKEQHHLEWAEVALGLRSKLDISHIKMTDQRFGDAIVTLDGPANAMEVRATPQRTAHLQLHNAELGSHSAELRIFSTAAVPGIPVKLSQARLSFGRFDLFVQTGTPAPDADDKRSLKTKVRWEYDAPFSLQQMGAAARTMKLVLSPGTRFSLQLGASSLVEFESGKPPAMHPHFDDYLTKVEAVASVATHVGLGEVEATGTEVEAVPWSALLTAAIIEQAKEVELLCPHQPVENGKQAVLVVASGFPIAQSMIFACGSLPMKGSSDGDSLKFVTEGCQCLGTWTQPIGDARKFQIIQKHAELVKQLETKPDLHVFSVDPRTDAGLKELSVSEELNDG